MKNAAECSANERFGSHADAYPPHDDGPLIARSGRSPFGRPKAKDLLPGPCLLVKGYEARNRETTHMPPVIEAPDFPAFWADCVNQGRIDDLIALYHEGAVLMPTFSPHAAKNREQLRDYFTLLFTRKDLQVQVHEKTLDCLRTGERSYVVNGIYDFRFDVDGTFLTFPSRFTFMIDLGNESPILHHHSSQIPRP